MRIADEERRVTGCRYLGRVQTDHGGVHTLVVQRTTRAVVIAAIRVQHGARELRRIRGDRTSQ